MCDSVRSSGERSTVKVGPLRPSRSCSPAPRCPRANRARANASRAPASSVVNCAGRISSSANCASRAAVTDAPAVLGMCAKYRRSAESIPAQEKPLGTFLAGSAARFGHRGLGLFELRAHELQAVVPERGVGEVDADDLAELLGALRAAGPQHVEVAR